MFVWHRCYFELAARESRPCLAAASVSPPGTAAAAAVGDWLTAVHAEQY